MNDVTLWDRILLTKDGIVHQRIESRERKRTKETRWKPFKLELTFFKTPNSTCNLNLNIHYVKRLEILSNALSLYYSFLSHDFEDSLTNSHFRGQQVELRVQWQIVPIAGIIRDFSMPLFNISLPAVRACLCVVFAGLANLLCVWIIFERIFFRCVFWVKLNV